MFGEGGGVVGCPIGLTSADTRPGVWLRNKPMDLSSYVSEDVVMWMFGLFILSKVLLIS